MLRTFREKKLATDDVFQQNFLSAIVFSSSRSDLLLESDARAVLLAWGTRWFEFAKPGNSLRLGPQLLCDGVLVPVSLLYDDTAGAFLCPLKFDPDIGFWYVRPLFMKSLLNPDSSAAGVVPRNRIAVRSRAAMPTCIERPLQGLRMTVKDMFALQGHRTGLGSRAYLDLAQPATGTAPIIQRLIDLGADLVGVSKLCAMVGKTDSTQTIDYEAPWNPRADGFQSPSGGSSGQPSALAAYDWLDFAIGSDSTVSGRLPAQANGVFSFRLSVGTVSTEGMWSAVAPFDTPCVFARDIDVIQMIAGLWQTKPSSPQSGTRSLRIYQTTDFLPLQNEQQMNVFDCFVGDVCRCLTQQVERISIAEIWKRNPPLEAKEQDLKDFLSPTVATRSYVYDFWKKVSPFIAAYYAQFHRQPFFPPPKGRNLWDNAKEVTPTQNEKAWAKVAIYKNWLMETVLKSESEDAIVVSPLGDLSPCYRDEWPAPPSGDQQMWEPLLMAPILGAPEIVVPAGEMKYQSRISGREEFLPVCVAIMGLPGTDQDLLDLTRSILERSGRSTKVSVGRRMFER
jgi:Asp-tRNA(Asn)/Glu-tRNA(Gln) amidotransferase A subunit family amidase